MNDLTGAVARTRARLEHGDSCHERVMRGGRREPCDKPAVPLNTPIPCIIDVDPLTAALVNLTPADCRNLESGIFTACYTPRQGAA